MPRAFYNEIEPYAAEWLRNLIAAGILPDGDVDERDIRDIRPSDLVGYTQCHFFAGIGVWAYALRLAEWPDDRPVWTGSCPCQPFSAAGRGDGFADERHLWPAWFHLIEQCRPATLIGEQVASKAVEPWVDLVQSDLEALGYDFGAVPVPAAGVGAPHIRDRLWWVAHPALRGQREQRHEAQPGRRGHADGEGKLGRLGNHHHPRLEGHDGDRDAAGYRAGAVGSVAAPGIPRGLADANGWHASAARLQRSREHGQQPQDGGAGHKRRHGQALLGAAGNRGVGGVADDDDERRQRIRGSRGGRPGSSHDGYVERPGPTNGFWRDADWIFCRDGKWRPIEPGSFPLAHGVAGRVAVARPEVEAPQAAEDVRYVSRTGTLRAFGNAIVPQVAQAFIEAYCDARGIALPGCFSPSRFDGDPVVNEAIAAAAKKGLQVWSLSQGYDKLWRCRLWNPVKNATTPFTGTGIGSTPEGAITAALTSDMVDSLWDDEMLRYRVPPRLPDVLRNATAARDGLTRAIAR